MLITVAGLEHWTEQSLCSREVYVRMEDTNEQASKQTLRKVVCAIIKNKAMAGERQCEWVPLYIMIYNK